MTPEGTQSETSPLLGPQGNGNAFHPPSNGAISDLRDSESVERDGVPQEAQGKDEMDERPNLRYIFPAISIGV
jgi:hypothetical protein